MQLRRPVGLETFEIQQEPDLELRSDDPVGVISDFLATFVGLEGLYVSTGPGDMDRLRKGVIKHCATLKRSVYCQRILDADPASDYFEEEYDLMTLGYSKPREICLMSLDELRLEAIGLTLLSQYLASVSKCCGSLLTYKLDFLNL